MRNGKKWHLLSYSLLEISLIGAIPNVDANANGRRFSGFTTCNILKKVAVAFSTLEVDEVYKDANCLMCTISLPWVYEFLCPNCFIF